MGKCGDRRTRTVMLLGSALAVLPGCAGMIEQWQQNQKARDDRQAAQIAPVKQQFAQDDGYASIKDDDIAAMKAGRAKFCQKADAFLTPQGPDKISQDYRRQEREMFQACLIAQACFQAEVALSASLWLQPQELPCRRPPSR